MKIPRDVSARLVFSCLVFSCHALVSNQTAFAQDGEIRFNDQIRPILTEYCLSCHGPDASSRKAELRLDLRDAALESGAIEPGDAASSELMSRINSDDPDEVMPPPKFGKKLPAEAKRLLARWIDAGAAWEKHWAFIPPRKAKLPAPAGVAEWRSNAIDHFTLAEMQRRKLQPNPPAARHVIARRLALDVSGLPPTDAQLTAFLEDDGERAWENYVDVLLRSEHAGEHRARYWLDAARYGDTHGMHVDNYREIWPYRDWVIRAFNANMPFNQFVVEQIAGDLLPNRTLQQQIATGFSRCNITTSEGGAIPEELDVRYMVDRVETTATVFLGMTAGCAVCHDHKFDPISQREFYQLGAYFNNTTQPAMDGNKKDTPPVVSLPGDNYIEEWTALQTKRKSQRSKLAASKPDAGKWWSQRERKPAEPVAGDGLLLTMPLTKGEGELAKLPKSATWATDHPAGKRGLQFASGGGLTAKLASQRSDEPLTVSFWFKTPQRLVGTTIFDRTSKTKNKKNIGWKINANLRGDVSFELHDGKGKKVRGLLPDNEALTPRTWQHVCVRYSGGLANSSISILVNGRAAALRNSSESYIQAVELPETPLKIASKLDTAAISDIRIFRRFVGDEEVQLLKDDYLLRQLLRSDKSWEQLKETDRELLGRFHHARQNRKRLLALGKTEQRTDFIYARSTTTLVMEERETDPVAWILERGEYTKKKDKVGPGVPSVLPPLSTDDPLNRLGLARWLVRPDHPLTARVMVNRLWQSVFGTGLVKTSEDFGVMGDAPSHPELLDWLAVEFVESGWDVNHIIKLMVTSSTYRQSGAVDADKLRKDPANRYLARGPRLRVDAEVLRDQVLAVSGLLNRQIGGPSVKPYQPDGLWNVVAITGSNTRYFKRDSGDALYRRSMYTFWKRTSPPPSMAALNAPTREQCTVRRERTNTPLQALVLMNDPQFVEAARHLAERTIKGRSDDKARAKWMLYEVLRRPAAAADLDATVATANEFRTLFKGSADSAGKLIRTGDSKPDPKMDAVELAAWTMVANMLMNRDDFVNK